MTLLPIPDELAAELQAHADRVGGTAEECARQAVARFLHSPDLTRDDSNYTTSAQDRIREGIAASVQGKVASQHEIESFFADWERDLQA